MVTSRRQFLHTTFAATAGFATLVRGDESLATSRAYAMLMGSLIGDALGGPVEFLAADRAREVMPDARSWQPDQTVDDATKERLAKSLVMHPYQELRPGTAPYGPWAKEAKRGTITDDSRHKIVLIRALRGMLKNGRDRLTQKDLARAMINFQPKEDSAPSGELAALLEEGMREYRYASHWILGDRSEKALPVERLWSGISNCSGQMVLLPMAALFPGQPERAYRETYAIDFVDAPIARDIVSSINAGLSAALDPRLDGRPADQRWSALLDALHSTDPYRMQQVPFAGRPLDRWLELADSIVKRAEGRPSRAYRLLETEGEPKYYWDAHFTLLVPLVMLKLCSFDPMSAMHLTLDFGHDTDSYAQILGAMAGAVHGVDILPKSMSVAVQSRLSADYGESVEDWARTLQSAASVWS